MSRNREFSKFGELIEGYKDFPLGIPGLTDEVGDVRVLMGVGGQ